MMWTETQLPRIRMRRNPAGGYVAVVPRLYSRGTVEGWMAAVNAKPGDGKGVMRWSIPSGVDTARPFQPARLEGLRSRKRKTWLREMEEQMRVVEDAADGLATYEVAAILGRSIRTAQRFIKRVRAERVYRGDCRNRRWTGCYRFWGVWT